MARISRLLICISVGIFLTLTVWTSTSHRLAVQRNQIQPSEHPITQDFDIQADKPLCPCNRSRLNVKNETTFHWCSEESTTRGFNQNIISYALYGNYENKGQRSKYYSVLNVIPQQARNVYPGNIFIHFYIQLVGLGCIEHTKFAFQFTQKFAVKCA